MTRGVLVRNALVFSGAGAGGLLRYGVGLLVGRAAAGPFPWATFLINVTGCVAMGALMYLFLDRRALTSNHRLFLMVGVLGGYTTFSSFGAEADQLLRSGQAALAAAYAISSVVFGIAGVTVGRAATKALLSGRGAGAAKPAPLEEEGAE